MDRPRAPRRDGVERVRQAHVATDLPLTERGRAAARGSRERLAGREFALVLTSPRARARDTAALAGFAAGGRPRPRRGRLRRLRGPDHEGDPRRAAGLVALERRRRRAARRRRRRARAPTACSRGRSRADGDVALFAHGHILRVLAARWLELPPERGASFALDTASLSELGFERENRVLARWNG